MRTLFSLIALTFVSSTAHAQDCTVRITDSVGMANFWEGSYEKKLKRILSRKGYTVVSNGPSTYTLGFGGGAGFVCGYGLTWWDSVFEVEARYRVELTGPGVHEESKKSGTGFTVGLGAHYKHLAFQAVRALPECHAQPEVSDQAASCVIADYDSYQDRPLSKLVKRVLKKRGYRIAKPGESASHTAGELCASAAENDYCSLRVEKTGTTLWTSSLEHAEGRSLVPMVWNELSRAHDYKTLKSCDELQ